MGSAGQSGMGGKGGAQMPQAPQQGMGAKGGGNPMPQKPPMGGMNPKGGSMPQKPPMMPQQGMNGKGGQLDPTTTFPGPGGQIPSQYGGFGQMPQQNGMSGKGGMQQMDPAMAAYANALRGQQMTQLNPQQQQNAMQYGNAYYGEPQRTMTPAEMARSGLSQTPQQNPMMDALTLHTPEYYKNMQAPQGQPAPPAQNQAQLAQIQKRLQGLPQTPAQMPPAPTAQRVAQPNSRQAAQRALQQFRPGMFRGMM